MLANKQIRWTALVALVIGLGLAVASGWFDREAVHSKDDAVAHSANAISSRLFAVASVFILMTALELQQARTSAKLQQMESELASLKHGNRATTRATA